MYCFILQTTKDYIYNVLLFTDGGWMLDLEVKCLDVFILYKALMDASQKLIFTFHNYVGS